MDRMKSYDERYISQVPAIEVLQKLGYQYLSPEKVESITWKLTRCFVKNHFRRKA